MLPDLRRSTSGIYAGLDKILDGSLVERGMPRFEDLDKPAIADRIVAAADKATDDFNLGLGFYRGKRWEQAEETLSQFLKEFPEEKYSTCFRSPD